MSRVWDDFEDKLAVFSTPDQLNAEWQQSDNDDGHEDARIHLRAMHRDTCAYMLQEGLLQEITRAPRLAQKSAADNSRERIVRCHVASSYARHIEAQISLHDENGACDGCRSYPWSINPSVLVYPEEYESSVFLT